MPMDRRTFLKSSGALAIGTGLPAANSPLLDVLASRSPILNDDRYCIIHPSALPCFLRIDPVGRWQEAYRAWRKAGRQGSDHPRSIMERFAYSPNFGDFIEIGTVSSFRFIVSATAPPATPAEPAP